MTYKLDQQDVDGLRWKLVLVEPTQEMVRAAYREQPDTINAGFAQAYRAMVSASPTRDGAEGARKIVCYAESNRCLGCPHYHGNAAHCTYMPAAPPKPTPARAWLKQANAALSPSPAVAAEPDATKIYAYHYLRATATTSSGKPALWQNELSFGKPGTHEFIRNVTPLYASPSVRGDREAMRAALEDIATLKVTRGAAANLAQSCLDSLSPFNPIIDREALAQTFAIHRWNAKLENLPDDMKDDCYAFAGSVILFGEQ